MKTNTTDKTLRLVLTGLMTAVVTVCVMALPIPIPMTTGYVNLGDGIIFLSVMLLGWKYGAFAGGVGASLADILLGAAAWAPGVGAGLDLAPGYFEWDRLAAVQIGHTPARVLGLPRLVRRQHAESSTQWMPGLQESRLQP